MKLNITSEITFKTARSGGSGGQNVNKVETMVEGRWLVSQSKIADELQKTTIFKKLSHKITAEGFLLVKSQSDRTQLGNKALVIAKINTLVNQAITKKQLRIATSPNKAAKEKRIAGKKKLSEHKTNRQKINLRNYE